MQNSGALKVLIILYYWPPAGGPGVQRWLKFSKYLKDFNIKPTVFVPKNPQYPTLDESLELEIPAHVKVIRSKISEPYKFASNISKKNTNTLSKGIIKEKKKQSLLQKSMLFIRGNFFIPDARARWIKPSVKKIDKLLKKEHFDAIITTGPPHSLHRIGYYLKSKHPNLPWIADFRDPWTTIGYHKDLKLTKSSQAKHLRMEKEVLTKADHLIVTSPSTLSEFEQKTSQPISLITNGFDDFEVEHHPDEHFSLAHIGTLLSERNPDNLWQAIAELVEENELFKSNLEIKFIGQVSESIIESIEKYGLKEHSRFLGYMPHKQAQEEMHNSQVLLLIEKNTKETQNIIPGKIFEYFQAKRPILGIGPKNWDVTEMIKKHQCGFTFNYTEKDEIKYAINAYFDAFMKGKLFINPKNIKIYHRKNLTAKLVNIINDIMY